MKKEILHLLILEDNPADAELAVRELEKEGFVVKWSLVKTEEAFREALNQRPWQNLGTSGDINKTWSLK